ncbi:DNA repair protein complementing XP-A cells [Bacillus rossius redtenbacheri]|uniref:DNA repair protein complementing XP-A cells n=1 Tax=Bacillus rossius redtenbacheri TaxID=93214 RepID=UPI002FDECD8D
MSKLENENKNEKFEVDENCPGSSSDSNQSPTKEIVLTDFQKARIEERRQKALLLRHRKLIPHPYAKIDKSSPEKSIIKVQGSRFVDTGGGFLLEEDDDAEEQLMKLPLTHQPAPIIEPDRPTCLECQAVFNDSFLFQTFDYAVCDACRDNDDKHALITKTDAKNEYLLKDCDLEKREPPLKFIVKKNPHNVRWGDMKLYLQIQVEERALEVWGSEEKLLEERELREEKKSKAKIKKYNKQVKALRMSVRSSLYDRTHSSSHEHTFGPETYNEDEDNYSRTCQTCKFEETFEKM